jgi:hypothetical protein
MSNEAVTVSDIVWRRPEDYADQTPTLIALTTIHYHFCPFTCHNGHNEEQSIASTDPLSPRPHATAP